MPTSGKFSGRVKLSPYCFVTLNYSVKIWPFQSQLEGDAMAIRYAVDLTDTERTELREIISKNKAKRSTIINAYILLKADRTCGWTNADIALAYEVSTKKVEQLKKRFVEEGFEAALYRKPVTNAHRRKITGDEEAHLIALYCSQAPEGHERWTLRMLADKMVELDIVDAVSHETIRRTLKKMNLNLGKRKNGVFRRSKMPLLSATWRTS
jgi:predicted hydrolase (HD superfamily)